MSLARGLVILCMIGGIVSMTGVAAIAAFGSSLEFARESYAAASNRLARAISRVDALRATESGDTIPKELVLLAVDEASAELQLQTAVTTMMRELEIVPNSFGSEQGRGEGREPSVRLNVEFDAGLNKTLALVDAIETHRPPLGIETLSLRQLAVGTIIDETPVTIRMVVRAFWLDSPDG